MLKGFAFQMTSYLALLFLLYTIVRFIAASMKNLLKGFYESDKKVDPFINNVYYPVSYWTERGGRPYQEDRFDIAPGIVEKDSSIYGVFDGHGGVRAADFCKDHFVKDLLADTSFPKDPGHALSRSFVRVDSDFSSKAKPRAWTDGTTATVAVVHGQKLFVANAGDSRCIIVQTGGKIKAMSNDHKPDREDEERRIRKLGGKVLHWGRWRVQGVLAVSRAIGDVALQPYVTSEPEVEEKELGPEDEFLVIASDGLWDVMSNEGVGKALWASLQGLARQQIGPTTRLSQSPLVSLNGATVHSNGSGGGANGATQGIGADRDFMAFVNSAKQLCGEALLLGSTDNVTVLVVDLRRRLQPLTAASTTGVTLTQATMASTFST